MGRCELFVECRILERWDDRWWFGTIKANFNCHSCAKAKGQPLFEAQIS